jgi:hypothetical protein
LIAIGACWRDASRRIPPFMVTVRTDAVVEMLSTEEDAGVVLAARPAVVVIQLAGTHRRQCPARGERP